MTDARLVEAVALRKKRSRFARASSAVWHDTWALLREFRRPLLIFTLAVFGGGFLYMILNNNYSDNAPLNYVDMPYIMVALMVLEASIDVPVEPYLIIFWYVMPLLAVYIVGRGAADFLRLFINRDQRRSAWEAAVASTYRRHIIVIGIGHTGIRIVRELSQMGFEVVAIDLEVNKEAQEELQKLDVPLVAGDARAAQTLETAQLNHANAVIVVTSNDHVNLEVAMRIRDTNEDIRLVLRMWDRRLAQQIERFFNVEALSASDLAAPAFAGAAVGAEITQNLHIAGLEYSMIRLTVRAGSFMDGQTVAAIQESEGVDIVLLHRADDGLPDVHPRGDVLMRGDDTLVLFAQHDQITEIIGRNETGS